MAAFLELLRIFFETDEGDRAAQILELDEDVEDEDDDLEDESR